MNPYAGHIYTDGSCYHNPGGKGGVAGIIEYPENTVMNYGCKESVEIFSRGYKSTTNNRMEMRAVIMALEYIKQNEKSLREIGVDNVEIFTDSQVTLNCFNNADTLRVNKWFRGCGAPVRNKDLIKRFLTIKESLHYGFRLEHVKGKSNEVTNSVDKLAKSVTKKILYEDYGYIKPKISKSNVKGPTESFYAIGQNIPIRIFEHSPLSKNSEALYKVKFNILVDGVMEKYYAHTTQIIDSKLDRSHYYQALFNNNTNNPLILEVDEITEDKFMKYFVEES